MDATRDEVDDMSSVVSQRARRGQDAFKAGRVALCSVNGEHIRAVSIRKVTR